MLSITKIFRFETAHAIYGYPGPCAYIHGHTYELHVGVKAHNTLDGYLDDLGILIDFKELKSIVQENVVRSLDHKLILSKTFLANTADTFAAEALVVFDYEPTAENILVYIRENLLRVMPSHVRLCSLQLWETRDSYVEWQAKT
jgi:6-pyruvoyltetrahydropterin/6-carboxytetrahydropterin synthase